MSLRRNTSSGSAYSKTKPLQLLLAHAFRSFDGFLVDASTDLSVFGLLDGRSYVFVVHRVSSDSEMKSAQSQDVKAARRFAANECRTWYQSGTRRSVGLCRTRASIRLAAVRCGAKNLEPIKDIMSCPSRPKIDLPIARHAMHIVVVRDERGTPMKFQRLKRLGAASGRVGARLCRDRNVDDRNRHLKRPGKCRLDQLRLHL